MHEVKLYKKILIQIRRNYEKRIKNIISLVLVIALAISGITYTTETKADEKKILGKLMQLKYQVRDNL